VDSNEKNDNKDSRIQDGILLSVLEARGRLDDLNRQNQEDPECCLDQISEDVRIPLVERISQFDKYGMFPHFPWFSNEKSY
jgi:hypothetical protein